MTPTQVVLLWDPSHGGEDRGRRRRRGSLSKLLSPALSDLNTFIHKKEVPRAVLLLIEVKVEKDLFLYWQKYLSNKTPKTKLSLEQKSRLKT